MTVVAEQTFAPPRPGAWFLDPTHFTRPATRFHAELFPEQMIAGFSEGLRRYGSLLEYLDVAFVNGFFYYCPRPVGAPQEAVGHPPREVWDELAQSQPEIRARLETSTTVFERKPWREDLEALGPRGETGRDPRPPEAAGGRARGAEHRGSARLSRPLPREPEARRVHPPPVQHARARSDRGLPRARARVDGAARGGAAEPSPRRESRIHSAPTASWSGSSTQCVRTRRREPFSTPPASRERCSQRCAPFVARPARRLARTSIASGTGP